MKRHRSVADLPDVSIECRTQRHAWTWLRDESLIYNGRTLVQYTQVDGCMRGCGTKRSRILDGDGHIIKAKASTYADDYLLASRVDNAEVRREAFARRHREHPAQPSGSDDLKPAARKRGATSRKGRIPKAG